MNALQLLSECITLGIERGSLYKIGDLVSELFIAFCNCFPAVVIVDACAYSDYNDEDGGKNLPPRMLVCLPVFNQIQKGIQSCYHRQHVIPHLALTFQAKS